MTEELEKKNQQESLKVEEEKAVTGEVVQPVQQKQPPQQQSYLPSSQSFFFARFQKRLPDMVGICAGCSGFNLHS